MYQILVSMFGAYCLLITAAHGMKCQDENSPNPLDRLLESCPRYYENATKSYCCEDVETKSKFCCDEEEYNKLNPGTSPAIIATAVLIPAVVFAGIGYLAWHFKLCPGVIYKRASGSDFGN